ncbi:MAG TPA: fused MFS/spermidine synthase [Opitutaceae bacterium]|jgi:hypothetical protein|nr:fused MFS/spermidine synthase [Opitutaceae bacterium]
MKPLHNLKSLFIPATFFPRVLFWIVIAIVPLASFLSFTVQPLVGKLLLPVQGGAAPTWLGVMLYFQLALLLAYIWAIWLLKRRPLTQVTATASLALIGALSGRLNWVYQSPWTGLGGIVCTLALATLPAMILLFSMAPLMHGWLRRQGQPVPYYLYAFSNAGGLAAVLLYPFTIERAINLSDQIMLWHGLLWALAALISAGSLAYLRCSDSSPAAESVSEPITLPQVAKWTGLSALTCLGMLGATHHLAAEIGSNPLAWVGPFGAYLLSFLVIFSGRWQPRFTLICLGWLAISLTGFMLTKGVSNATVNGGATFWLISLTAAGSFFGNGLIHDSRPRERFDFFYLALAAGGVLGGLFASLGAPVLFLRPSEFLIVSCVFLTLGLLRLIARRDGLTMAIVIVIVAAPIAGVAWQQTQAGAAGTIRVRRFRNIYGCTTLRFEENGLVLSNETTTHGSQITTDAVTRRRPTLYYSESTGVGRMIEELQKAHPSFRMSVVGLGAGTLAAYARPGDSIDFWDIDPKAIRIARDFFTYISDSRGQINIQQRDGRKGLEASHTDYDLIVIDAFTGDGIPAHLLTREALAAYFSRLDNRHGLLAIHATNRYSTLFPIIGATAHSLGWSALNVFTEISSTAETRDWDATNTQYILLCRPEQLARITAWLPAEEDDGRVKRTLTEYAPEPPGSTIVWTDERHAALDALDLRRYLFGQ